MTPTEGTTTIRTERAHGPDFSRTKVACCVVLVLPMVAAYLWTLVTMTPLQRQELPEYIRASVFSPRTLNQYKLAYVVLRDGTLQWPLPDDVTDIPTNAAPTLSDSARARGITDASFRTFKNLAAGKALAILRPLYAGLSISVLQGVPMAPAVLAAIVLACIAYTRDRRRDQRERDGIWRRGSKRLTRAQFNETLGSDGVGLLTRDPVTPADKALEKVRRKSKAIVVPSPQLLAIPRRIEQQHILVAGDTGAGKTMILRQLARQIRARKELAVIYDPAAEFTAEFYDPDRGDVILNPLDTRCPYWSPSEELTANAEALTIAHSMFPDNNSNNQFFVDAPRAIFAHLIQFDSAIGKGRVTPQELADWLANPEEIDRRIYGTELQHILSKGAPNQREGVLASLAKNATSIRLLPPRSECNGTWTARQWCTKRPGWIFVTTTPTTREAQLPLIGMWFDCLILRLMDNTAGNPLTPVWLLMDEIASARRLPQLESTALTELRKYNGRVVLDFQAMSQLQKTYGDKGATTILSQPATKIFLRLGDPDLSKWVSRTLGEHEVARRLDSSSKSDAFTAAGRSSTKTYHWEIKTEPVAIPAEIQGLPDLHGYVNIEKYVTRFILEPTPAERRQPPVVLRPTGNFVPKQIPQQRARGFSPRSPEAPVIAINRPATLKDQSNAQRPDTLQPTSPAHEADRPASSQANQQDLTTQPPEDMNLS